MTELKSGGRTKLVRESNSHGHNSKVKKTQVIRSVTFCTVNISVLAVLDFKLKSGKNM